MERDFCAEANGVSLLLPLAVGTDCVSVYCVSAVGRGSNHRVALTASRPVGDRELREKEWLKLGTLSPQTTGEITNT